jgi:hypothetical protein
LQPLALDHSQPCNELQQGEKQVEKKRKKKNTLALDDKSVRDMSLSSDQLSTVAGGFDPTVTVRSILRCASSQTPN